MENITYSLGAVHGVASDMGTQAGQLQEIRDSIAQTTGMLQEFFAGVGATGYFDAQAQALSGMDGLIETVGNHGRTVGDTADQVHAHDVSLTHLF